MSLQIQVGSTIPTVNVKEDAADKSEPLLLDGKNIIVGVPGAFTGTCHAQVPGYIDGFADFQAKGVKRIYIVAVNDVFVTKAWKKNLAPEGTEVHFIADDAATFSKAIGLTFDATAALGTPRSKRYVMVVEDNKVISIEVEPEAGKVTKTGASEILTKL